MEVLSLNLRPPMLGLKSCLIFQNWNVCSLIVRILPHFPHLTTIYFVLPTVKFLRAFAKTMATTGPESFQGLQITTQFDFAFSLDSCIPDNVVKPSDVEMKTIKVLKDYPHWEQYVKKNQIELPQENAEEEPNKYCGLGVLFKKLKFFGFLHTPRTLKLP